MSADTVLTDEQIEQGREAIFSTNNPFCPCDSKTMRKAARWAEQAVLQSEQVQAWREAEDVLRRNGFVKCDIPACNCGSWHARYGLPERMQEIKDALVEAGHPLSNDNGNLAINALSQLIKESQAWKRDAERLDWLADPNNSIGNVQLPTECVIENLHSLRAAIDAAMKKSSHEN